MDSLYGNDRKLSDLEDNNGVSYFLLDQDVLQTSMVCLLLIGFFFSFSFFFLVLGLLLFTNENLRVSFLFF